MNLMTYCSVGLVCSTYVTAVVQKLLNQWFPSSALLALFLKSSILSYKMGHSIRTTASMILLLILILLCTVVGHYYTVLNIF